MGWIQRCPYVNGRHILSLRVRESTDFFSSQTTDQPLQQCLLLWKSLTHSDGFWNCQFPPPNYCLEGEIGKPVHEWKCHYSCMGIFGSNSQFPVEHFTYSISKQYCGRDIKTITSILEGMQLLGLHLAETPAMFIVRFQSTASQLIFPTSSMHFCSHMERLEPKPLQSNPDYNFKSVCSLERKIVQHFIVQLLGVQINLIHHFQ